MANIFTRIKIFLAIVMITNSAVAQDFDIHQASNAVILQVNENTRTENILNGVTLAMPTTSNVLTVKFYIPYDSTNKPADNNNSAFSTQGLLFDLKMNIDPVSVQQNITSAKTFETHGNLTLNDSTKDVFVQYMPLPAGPDQAGEFNLSLLIQFNPADFNMDDQHTNSNFIIKISNTPVNRR